jgi:hypothetical protein
MFPPFGLRNGNDEGNTTVVRAPYMERHLRGLRHMTCRRHTALALEVAHMHPYSSCHQHIQQLADVLHLLQILDQIDYLANARSLQHTVGTIFELVL